MGKSAQLAFCALVLVVAIISITFENSSTFSRPVQSSIIVLTVAGCSLLLSDRFSPPAASPNFPLHTLLWQNFSFSLWSKELLWGVLNGTHPLTPAELKILGEIVCLVICLRIGLFQLTSGNWQCTRPGTEGYVPLILAVYDYWENQLRRPIIEEILPRKWLRKVTRGPARFILPISILSGVNIYNSIHTNANRSTYICPLSSTTAMIMPIFSILAVLLDCCLLISIEKFTRRGVDTEASTRNVVYVWTGSIALTSACFLSLGGFIAFIVQPKYWSWVLGVDRIYFTDLTMDTILFTAVAICAVEICSNHGLIHLLLIVTFVSTYASGLAYDLINRRSFVLFSQTFSFLSSAILLVGAALYLHISSLEGPSSFQPTQRLIYKVPLSSYAFLFFLLIGRTYYQFPQTSVIKNGHPIGILMSDAAARSQAWLAQASKSKTLSEAVDIYRQRYHISPPPGFDLWYRYATEKSSMIIDDYDNIHEDLLPFWSMSPRSIRVSTREILSDQWNEVAEVSIRSGKAEVGPNVIPTHRWMVDGVLATIESFVQWLPDMDLAFNINDEPRIAIPWKSQQKLQLASLNSRKSVDDVLNEWSEDRAQSWRPLGDSETPRRPFEDRSFANSFNHYGSVACPPASPARRYHPWSPRTLCASCAAPHSNGIFLSNWSLSASPCHQPDLAHLHGFYLSPAAFKPSHDLQPVFSQSKPHGYSDILYPSAWNYIDKVKYEPSESQPDLPFASKENTLFWRGATSEGLTKHATWKGMARQRLVHLANNATQPVPIPLPIPNQPSSYAYHLLPPSSLGLNLDIGIVDSIARCWDSDCDNQALEFGLVGKTDFQDHWRYKFLFDLDGAGFSGRFLPFLQSHSLIFKTAIFREWWDGRVFPWKHFIPVDVRFHGLLGTLAYFAGTSLAGGGNAKRGDIQANLKAGEEIAEAGREWGGKVLRKEDMEIYMFRLLLEWGRLTDDKRHELGYVVPAPNKAGTVASPKIPS